MVQDVILARDRTLELDFEYTYHGSVPYGTLDRGEDSGAELLASVAFLSEEEGLLETPEGWVDFWRDHTESPTAQPPAVDWANEMVLVAADGKRTEAGDSLEFRRILQTGEGTQVTIFERAPGTQNPNHKHPLSESAIMSDDYSPWLTFSHWSRP